jgi:hypothetical protein
MQTFQRTINSYTGMRTPEGNVSLYFPERHMTDPLSSTPNVTSSEAETPSNSTDASCARLESLQQGGTCQSTSGIKLWATIEFLPGQCAAIVELHSTTGEWAGGGRVECRSGRRSDLYELGYDTASMRARAKGGALDRFSEYVAPAPPRPADDFLTFAKNCGSRVELPTLRRPGNALNVEAGFFPSARCLDKRPSHWPESATSLRWLGSGGDASVFGLCSRNCPMLRAKR